MVGAAVIGVIVVVAIGLVVVGLGGDEKPRVVSDEERAANAKRAQYVSEFGVVCDTGSISNAGEFRKPYSVIAFEEGHSGHSYVESTLQNAPGFVAKDSSVISSINVVACLRRRPGTEVKSGSCKFDSGKEVDRYAVEYDLVVHEAKSGKVIKELGTVPGPVNGCPMFVILDAKSPKIYGSPDDREVIEKLTEFVGSK